MRRKITALLLALCMACTLTMTACAASASESRGGEAAPLTSGEEGALPFSDVPGDAWYAPAVAYCRENGLMAGASDTAFDPEGAVTRAMTAAVLRQAAGSPAPTVPAAFSDVPENAWYAQAVAWAAEKGLFHGYGDGRFGPDDPVTGEQLAIVLRAYGGEEAAAGVTDPDSREPAPRWEVAVALYALLTGEQLAPGTESQSRVLAAYFSATGTTRWVAEQAAELLGADLYEIVPAEPYTAADLDYTDSSSRANREQSDPAARPALAGEDLDLADYGTVLLGYPIWHGRPPRIVSTFLETYDLSGKTIVPFSTSGGSAFSAAGLAELAPDALWTEGRRLNGASREDLGAWLDGLGLHGEEETSMTLVVKNGGTEIRFALNDSPAARALLAQLPLTLEVRPFSSNEQTFYPPEGLDVSGTPAITSARAGTLAYYAPWEDVVMFYEDFSGGSGGLYELGSAIEGVEEIRGLNGTITISAE